MNSKRLLVGFVVVAALGLSVFAFTVSRVTSVERLAEEEALARFETLRARFDDPIPKITIGDDGEVIAAEALDIEAPPVHTLHVLAYRGPLKGLVQVDVPIWILRLKALAV